MHTYLRQRVRECVGMCVWEGEALGTFWHCGSSDSGEQKALNTVNYVLLDHLITDKVIQTSDINYMKT